MKKVTLKLNGLDCANCANKIEESVLKIKTISEINLNFVTKTLIYKVSEENSDEILSEIKAIIKKIEPQIKVHEEGEGNHSHDENESVKGVVFRLIIAGILFVLSIVSNNDIFSLVAIYLSYIIVGYDVFFSAIKNIFKVKPFDEAFLMTVATVGAFFIGQNSEGVAVMIFYQVGELFQSLAVNRSRKSISDLMDIRPDFAVIKDGANEIKVNPSEVKVGDIIIVKSGERIALDGVIVSGNSSIDTSALTGESMPREVSLGNEVLSGSVNLSGVIEVKVSSNFAESTVSKILDLVENASSKKATTEKFITRFARIYTPVVVIVATALAIIPPLIIENAQFSDWVYRSLIFLVISCPCALVISVPLSFFGGIGGASRSGILVKGANALEMLSRTEIIAFDKTGTLTKGTFTVAEISAESIDKNELLEITAHIESFSNHPIAQSIVNSFVGEIDKSRVRNITEIAGKGISAVLDEKNILVGNSKLMEENGVKFKSINSIGTPVFTAIDGDYAGYILVSDEIKPDAIEAISRLKDIGINKTVMLTGDKKQVAEQIAEKIGINEVYAELLPVKKVEIIEKLLSQKSKGKMVAFVGDGINDAPVLARADVGIAMGGLGSDSAIEAADIVLMTDEPKKIAAAIKISRRTLLIAKQNIIFAIAVKFVVLGLGATGHASMWLAVFADVGVSLLAILNALRALKKVE